MGPKRSPTPHPLSRASYLAVIVFAALSGVGEARAAEGAEPEETPHENRQGLPGIIRMGIPVPTQHWVVLGGSAGYGFIDAMYTLDAPGHRLEAQGAVAFSPLPFLVVGADMWGRVDFFGAEDDADPNLYGEPRLTARFQHSLTPDLYLGGELGIRLIGEQAPDIQPNAISPSLEALIGARLAPRTWLAGSLGFHLDNSDNALPDPELVPAVDRITVGASSSPSIPWGVGVTHRLASETELLGELSGEILVGGNAPKFFESPWGLSVGARQPFGEQVSVMAAIDVGLSARGFMDDDELVPVIPRLGAFATFIWRPGARPPEKPKDETEDAAVEKPPEEKLPPPIPTTPVKGSVVDEGGRPLPDVQIVLKRAGAPDVEARTYADGTFVFEEVPEGAVELVIKTPGYDEQTISFAEGQERQKEVVLYPSLPAGQVKGEVRDLQGKPLPETKVFVSPGDKEVKVAADGTFSLELAPGRYTVRFEHPELSQQKRVIRVQDRGVVILNIALTP